MIALKSIEKVYRTDTIETVALSNINLEVAEGEFVSIMGPSGCGKSTLLNVHGPARRADARARSSSDGRAGPVVPRHATSRACATRRSASSSRPST